MAHEILFKQYGDQWGNFSALAQAAVSGGQFVKAMSTAAPSATGKPEDIEVDLCNAAGDESLCVGIATNDAASGERVTVATRGIFKTWALGTIVAGSSITAASDSSVADAVKVTQYQCLGSGVSLGVDLKAGIGRALNDAASGERVFITLNAGGGI